MQAADKPVNLSHTVSGSGGLASFNFVILGLDNDLVDEWMFIGREHSSLVNNFDSYYIFFYILPNCPATAVYCLNQSSGRDSKQLTAAAYSSSRSSSIFYGQLFVR